MCGILRVLFSPIESEAFIDFCLVVNKRKSFGVVFNMSWTDLSPSTRCASGVKNEIACPPEKLTVVSDINVFILPAGDSRVPAGDGVGTIHT
jgi:hypothetical protein